MDERKYENNIPFGINARGIIINGVTTRNVFAELLNCLAKKKKKKKILTHLYKPM